MDYFDVTVDEFYTTVESIFREDMIYYSYIANATISQFIGSVESWQRDIGEYCTVCSPTV